MKYIYSTSQMSKLSLTLHTFSITGSVAGLFLIILAFDIAQFFLFFNHQLLPLILDKTIVDSKISQFFWNYLVGRKTKYLWNNFSSPLFNVDVRVRQGSTLSLILSALYLFPIFHIFEKRVKNLKIPISIISFIDNGLFISQDKPFTVSNSHLSCSYYIMFSLLKQFGLVIEHRKTEVFYFHFFRVHGVFNPPPLDLTILRDPILYFKEIWHYLGFIFDRKLTFR